MTKTEKLENEIKQRTHELNVSLSIQNLLHERLKESTRELKKVENLLKTIEDSLRYSNTYIYTLEQKNKNLKLSCDIWMKRSIRLQFEVLKARDET